MILRMASRLTPSQYSCDGKSKPGTGYSYLRTLLIQEGCPVLMVAEKKTDSPGDRGCTLVERRFK